MGNYWRLRQMAIELEDLNMQHKLTSIRMGRVGLQDGEKCKFSLVCPLTTNGGVNNLMPSKIIQIIYEQKNSHLSHSLPDQFW